MTFARAGAATSTVAVLLVAGRAAGGAGTVADEPIVALISRAWDADPDGTDGMVRMEELISQCMYDAGLEYTPGDYDEPTVAADPALEPGTAEVATALADLTCREAVSYDAERERIAAEHQQRFTQAHRVELEAWVASSEGTDR